MHSEIAGWFSCTRCELECCGCCRQCHEGIRHGTLTSGGKVPGFGVDSSSEEVGKVAAVFPDGITYEVLAALPPVALQILTNCINGLFLFKGGNCQWGTAAKSLMLGSAEVEKLEKLRPICLM
eukprot:749556-Hanusia_phi.AAC.1